MNYYAILKTDGLLTADLYSDYFEARYSKTQRFTFHAPTTGTPVGKWKFQICDDLGAIQSDVATGLYGTSNETANWTLMTIPLGSIHVESGFTAPAADVAEIDWDGTAALEFWADFVDTGFAVRAWWDHTSGGTAGSLVQIRGTGFEE